MKGLFSLTITGQQITNKLIIFSSRIRIFLIFCYFHTFTNTNYNFLDEKNNNHFCFTEPMKVNFIKILLDIIELNKNNTKYSKLLPKNKKG